MRDFIWAISVMLTISAIFIGITAPTAFIISRASCISSYSDYSPEYGVLSGCRIMWHGKRTPVDAIRNISLQ